MIVKESINTLNFPELRHITSQKREDSASQEAALADTKTLREFAMENDLKDESIELFLEEALIHQHFFMETQDSSYLQEMKRVITQAFEYLKANNLTRWESRVARFMGRISDYEKNYQAAADYYKEAIGKIHLDPLFSKNKALRLELEGFLIIDELRLGIAEESILKVEKLHQDYEQTSEGQELKQKDYTTWAIWRSGLLINLCKTLIELGKLELYREKIDKWLRLAESDLRPAKEVETWSDFSFRQNEIAKIREII